MAENARDYAPISVPASSARAELENLLADPQLRVSVRNRAFLKYVSEATIEGRSHSIKGYSIGVDVFGRGTNFDANADPIVRIEATRLRNALDQYYISIGAEHDVHIRLPRGRYVPDFEQRSRPESDIYFKLVATYQIPQRGLPPAAVAAQASSKDGWLSARFALLWSAVLRLLR